MDGRRHSTGTSLAARPREMDEAAARTAVGTATMAPSIHNTQPWRWRLRGGVLDLFADRSRQLDTTDPAGRQLLESCGAALLHARLGLRGVGLEVRAALLPDPDDPDHLAALEVTGNAEPTVEERAMLAAVRTRHTDRRPFDPRPVPAAAVDAMRAAAEVEGGWLASLDHGDLRLETSVLLAKADWLETQDPAYRAELLRWTRTEPDAVDGIPRSAVVHADQPRQSEFPLRDFDVAGVAGQHMREVTVERPAAFALGTDADGPVDWLRAGQALGRLLLVASARGLVASPLGQVVDLGGYRDLLRHAFGGYGHVQMLLRIGYPVTGSEPAPPTPRRPLDEVLLVEPTID